MRNGSPSGDGEPPLAIRAGESIAGFSIAAAMDAFHLAFPAGSVAERAFESCIGGTSREGDGEDGKRELFHDVVLRCVCFGDSGHPGLRDRQSTSRHPAD